MPYVFGNHLYHKFNDRYSGNRTESWIQPLRICFSLKPRGRVSDRTLLGGPLGCLESLERRTFSPTLNVVLWHCSDPGCQARHLVKLEPSRNTCTQAVNSFKRHLSDHFGPASEWQKAMLDLSRAGGEWTSVPRSPRANWRLHCRCGAISGMPNGTSLATFLTPFGHN